MTTAILDKNPPSSDTELVSASRKGDRNAFGQIVRRYQSMVTGLIYASCGDLHHSEDLAQETFISAWKSLSGLREPAKLAGWLCQIARHRLIDQSRSDSREKTHLTNLFHGTHPKTEPPADAEVLSEEEKGLLWRTLSNIAQPYRETLVLYYRQGQSTADVAAAMETNEQAVRQRLSRGREMLREHVAAVLERNLARSAPNTAFTLAVVAALPAIGVESVKAATLGAAVKGSSAAKGWSILTTFGWLVGFIGPIFAVFVGIFSARKNIRSAETPREKRFIVSSQMVLGFIVVAAMGLLFALNLFAQRWNWSGTTSVVTQAGAWAICGVVFVSWLFWNNYRHRQVRQQEGLTPAVPSAQSPLKMNPFRYVAIWNIGGFGGLFGLASQAGDTLALAIIAACIVLFIACGDYFMRRRRTVERLLRLAIVQGLLIGVVTILMEHWRLHAWLASISGRRLSEMQQRAPLWAVDLMTIVIIAWIEAMIIVPLWLSQRNLKADSAAK